MLFSSQTPYMRTTCSSRFSTGRMPSRPPKTLRRNVVWRFTWRVTKRSSFTSLSILRRPALRRSSFLKNGLGPEQLGNARQFANLATSFSVDLFSAAQSLSAMQEGQSRAVPELMANQRKVVFRGNESPERGYLVNSQRYLIVGGCPTQGIQPSSAIGLAMLWVRSVVTLALQRVAVLRDSRWCGHRLDPSAFLRFS